MGCVPSKVVPSAVNVTAPVGGPAPGDVLETVERSVTVLPTMLGFGEAVRVVVVGEIPMMVWLRVAALATNPPVGV